MSLRDEAIEAAYAEDNHGGNLYEVTVKTLEAVAKWCEAQANRYANPVLGAALRGVAAACRGES